MPFYHALVQPGLAGETERASFANAIVDIHCEVTGAPRSFVHVMFTDDDHGKLPDGQSCSVRATIRSGRTDAQKERIVTGLQQAFVDRVGGEVSAVAVATSEIEASFTMEGGKLLPEPGSPEEELWKAAG
jgi:phenylpyruvate tautomerase PptA (4-oxalocrotonate tautomerase family)